MYKNFAPKWHGRYLSSNVNITVSDGKGGTINTPVGSMYSISSPLILFILIPN